MMMVMMMVMAGHLQEWNEKLVVMLLMATRMVMMNNCDLR